MNQIEIFLSHSSADVKVAKALIDLIRDAFNIEADRIRCTSVPGYKPPAGAHTETQLRREIQQVRVFIGLLSEVSVDSAYVLFELGARWGMMQDSNYYGQSQNKIIPVLAAGASGSILRDPLKAYNALNCESSGDLHQLIEDIGKQLAQQPKGPAAYQEKMDTLIRVSRQLKGARTRAKKAAKEREAKAVAAGTQTAIVIPRKPATKRAK